LDAPEWEAPNSLLLPRAICDGTSLLARPADLQKFFGLPANWPSHPPRHECSESLAPEQERQPHLNLARVSWLLCNGGVWGSEATTREAGVDQQRSSSTGQP
jgi:hypothetical protein